MFQLAFLTYPFYHYSLVENLPMLQTVYLQQLAVVPEINSLNKTNGISVALCKRTNFQFSQTIITTGFKSNCVFWTITKIYKYNKMIKNLEKRVRKNTHET